MGRYHGVGMWSSGCLRERDRSLTRFNAVGGECKPPLHAPLTRPLYTTLPSPSHTTILTHVINPFSSPTRPLHTTISLAPPIQGNEARIYEFVTRHFLACLSRDAEGVETKINVDVNDEGFHLSGLMILSRNYLDVYPYDKWSAKVLSHSLSLFSLFLSLSHSLSIYLYISLSETFQTQIWIFPYSLWK